MTTAAILTRRKLKIELYNSSAEMVKTLIVDHLDATKHVTELYSACDTETGLVSNHYLHEKIETINIFMGLVTIYYVGGHFMEITRYFD